MRQHAQLNTIKRKPGTQDANRSPVYGRVSPGGQNSGGARAKRNGGVVRKINPITKLNKVSRLFSYYFFKEN